MDYVFTESDRVWPKRGGCQRTYYVNPSPRRGYFTSINEAISKLADYDALEIGAGRYFENIVVSKPILFLSEGDVSSVVITSHGDTLTVDAKEASFEGLTVTTQGSSSYALRLQSGATQLRNCNLKCLSVSGEAHPHIHECRIEGSDQHGVYLAGNSGGLFVECIIERHAWCSIWVESCGELRFESCYIRDGQQGQVYVTGAHSVQQERSLTTIKNAHLPQANNTRVGGVIKPVFVDCRIIDSIEGPQSTGIANSPAPTSPTAKERNKPVERRKSVVALDRGKSFSGRTADPAPSSQVKGVGEGIGFSLTSVKASLGDSSPAFDIGRTLPQLHRSAVEVQSKNTAPIFDSCWVINCVGNAFKFAGGAQGKLHRTRIKSNLGVGVVVIDGSKLDIRDSDIKENAGGGVEVSKESFGCASGTTIVMNGDCGVRNSRGCKNFRLERCVIARHKKSGVHCTEGGRITIDKSEIRQNGVAGVLIEDLSSPHITQNTITLNATGVLSINHGLGFVSENDVTDNHANAVKVAKFADTTFTKNRFSLSTVNVVVSQYGRGRFTDNTIKDGRETQILVSHYSAPMFEKNVISDGRSEGVVVTDAARGLFKHNIIQAHQDHNITLQNHADPVFEGNLIANSSREGIRIERAALGTFVGNLIRMNRGGIHVRGESYPVFRKNKVFGCADFGIKVDLNGGGSYEKNVVKMCCNGVVIEKQQAELFHTFGAFGEEASRRGSRGSMGIFMWDKDRDDTEDSSCSSQTSQTSPLRFKSRAQSPPRERKPTYKSTANDPTFETISLAPTPTRSLSTTTVKPKVRKSINEPLNIDDNDSSPPSRKVSTVSRSSRSPSRKSIMSEVHSILHDDKNPPNNRPKKSIVGALQIDDNDSSPPSRKVSTVSRSSRSPSRKSLMGEVHSLLHEDSNSPKNRSRKSVNDDHGSFGRRSSAVVPRVVSRKSIIGGILAQEGDEDDDDDKGKEVDASPPASFKTTSSPQRSPPQASLQPRRTEPTTDHFSPKRKTDARKSVLNVAQMSLEGTHGSPKGVLKKASTGKRKDTTFAEEVLRQHSTDSELQSEEISSQRMSLASTAQSEGRRKTNTSTFYSAASFTAVQVTPIFARNVMTGSYRNAVKVLDNALSPIFFKNVLEKSRRCAISVNGIGCTPLFLSNEVSANCGLGATICDGAGGVYLGCLFRGNGIAVAGGGTSPLLMSNCIASSDTAGISIERAAAPQILYNVVCGNDVGIALCPAKQHHGGVEVVSPPQPGELATLLHRNVIYENRIGIEVSSACVGTVISTNIIFNNTLFGVSSGPGGEVLRFDGNVVLGEKIGVNLEDKAGLYCTSLFFKNQVSVRLSRTCSVMFERNWVCLSSDTGVITDSDGNNCPTIQKSLFLHNNIALSLADTSRPVIRQNSICNNKIGLEISDSVDGFVSLNKIWRNTTNIDISGGGPDMRVVNNYLTESEYSVKSTFPARARFIGNIIKANTKAGVLMNGSHSVTCFGNFFSHHSCPAVNIMKPCAKGTAISGNTFFENTTAVLCRQYTGRSHNTNALDDSLCFESSSSVISNVTSAGGERQFGFSPYPGEERCEIAFRSNVIRDHSETAILITEGAGFFEENIIRSNKGISIAIRAPLSKVTFTKNTIRDGLRVGILCEEGTSSVFCENTVYNNCKFGLWVRSDANPTVQRNVFYDNSEAGIYISDSGRGVFVGNRFMIAKTPKKDKPVKSHIIIDGEDTAPLLQSSDIYGASESGIVCRNYSSGIIENSIIRDNKRYGVEIYGHASPQIRRNNVFGNTLHGIASHGAKGLVESNLIFENLGGGVLCGPEASTTLKDNVIHNEQKGGLTFSASCGLAHGNVISSCYCFGVSFCGVGTTPTFANNLLTENLTIAALCESGAAPQIRNNTFRKNFGPFSMVLISQCVPTVESNLFIKEESTPVYICRMGRRGVVSKNVFYRNGRSHGTSLLERDGGHVSCYQKFQENKNTPHNLLALGGSEDNPLQYNAVGRSRPVGPRQQPNLEEKRTSSQGSLACITPAGPPPSRPLVASPPRTRKVSISGPAQRERCLSISRPALERVDTIASTSSAGMSSATPTNQELGQDIRSYQSAAELRVILQSSHNLVSMKREGGVGATLASCRSMISLVSTDEDETPAVTPPRDDLEVSDARPAVVAKVKKAARNASQVQGGSTVARGVQLLSQLPGIPPVDSVLQFLKASYSETSLSHDVMVKGGKGKTFTEVLTAAERIGEGEEEGRTTPQLFRGIVVVDAEVSILENVFFQNRGVGVWLGSGYCGSVSKNVFLQGCVGVASTGTSQVLVTDNSIVNMQIGISIGGSSRTLLVDEEVVACNFTNVLVTSLHPVKMLNCCLRASAQYGLLLERSVGVEDEGDIGGFFMDNCIITGNTIGVETRSIFLERSLADRTATPASAPLNLSSESTSASPPALTLTKKNENEKRLDAFTAFLGEGLGSPGGVASILFSRTTWKENRQGLLVASGEAIGSQFGVGGVLRCDSGVELEEMVEDSGDISARSKRTQQAPDLTAPHITNLVSSSNTGEYLVRSCTFSANGTGVITRSGANPKIYQSKILRSTREGILIEGGGFFEKNEVCLNENGLSTRNAANGVFFENQIYDNKKCGVTVSGGRPVFVSNMIHDNAEVSFLLESGLPQLKQNRIYFAQEGGAFKSTDSSGANASRGNTVNNQHSPAVDGLMPSERHTLQEKELRESDRAKLAVQRKYLRRRDLILTTVATLLQEVPLQNRQLLQTFLERSVPSLSVHQTAAQRRAARSSPSPTPTASTALMYSNEDLSVLIANEMKRVLTAPSCGLVARGVKEEKNSASSPLGANSNTNNTITLPQAVGAVEGKVRNAGRKGSGGGGGGGGRDAEKVERGGNNGAKLGDVVPHPPTTRRPSNAPRRGSKPIVRRPSRAPGVKEKEKEKEKEKDVLPNLDGAEGEETAPKKKKKKRDKDKEKEKVGKGGDDNGVLPSV